MVKLQTVKRTPNWPIFFREHRVFLSKKAGIVAQGGTIDSIKNEENKLVPSPHPVTIKRVRNLTSRRIATLFQNHAALSENLGSLYPWVESQGAEVDIPWRQIKMFLMARVSSFDSGEEHGSHFVAALHYATSLLTSLDVLIISQGTDSLANKTALFSVVLSPYLLAAKKKVIFVGSPESGYVEESLSISNISAALFTAVSPSIPPGVYVVTSQRQGGEIHTDVLPGLGSVKLHTDGYFYSPNTGSLLTINKKEVVNSAMYEDLLARIKQIGLLPYLSKFYLKDTAIDRLEETTKKVSIETVDNDPNVLRAHYDMGKRVFVVRARGAGNAPENLKKVLAWIAKKTDTTVVVITLADSGDVQLKKYAAGLDIPGVFSGRALREEAAWIMASVVHDLRMHEGYTYEDGQQLIERYCYLSGLV